MALADLPEVLTVEEAASVLRISRTAALRAGAALAGDQRARGTAGRAHRSEPSCSPRRIGTSAWGRRDDTVGAGHQCRGVRAEAAVAVQLVITASSRRVRAELGPLAWAAV